MAKTPKSPVETAGEKRKTVLVSEEYWRQLRRLAFEQETSIRIELDRILGEVLPLRLKELRH